MVNYAGLQTRVNRRVIDLPAAVVAEVPDLINEAIRALQDFHNFRIMRKSQTATTVLNTRKLERLPTDWKAFRGRPYYTSANGPVTQMTVAPNAQAALKAYGAVNADTVGTPRVLVAREIDDGGNEDIDVYPAPNDLSDHPDGNWRITVPYWRYLTALLNDSDTNWFTVNAHRWIINKATADAFALNWDAEREDKWLAKAIAAQAEVTNLDKRQWLAGVSTFVTYRGASEAKIRRL